ncbi:MAG: DUF6318 family protein [Kocuria sp.]|nr:DUF6318 family protein [Kocuria sp.]
MLSVRRVLVLSAVLVTGVLTGCASHNDTTATESPTPSTSTTGEYVPASADGPAQNVPKPTKPPKADEESVEGAQAFLDYLSDARAYAQQTGDTSIARELTAQECESCMEHYKSIDDLYKAGGWASKGRESVTVTSPDLPLDQYGSYAPTVSVDYEGITIWNKDGEVEREIPPEEFSEEKMSMHISYEDGEWTYLVGAPA